MIPMRQFLREHQISGEVVEYSPEHRAEAVPDGRWYRVTLTYDGQLRAFEAEIQRPGDAPAPTVGEGLAEIARRIASHSEQVSMGGTEDPTALESERLRQFMGDLAYRELLFEFGRRPEAQVEDHDVSGDPARPDEMTNQEPGALVDAGASARIPRTARYVIGAPVVVLGAVAGILLVRGRRVAAFAVAVGGTLAAVGGATTAAVWRRRHRRQSVKRTLQILTDQNAAIQRGEAST